MFIAPQLAGTLSALGQITGFVAAIVMPYVVGYITRSSDKVRRKVFCSPPLPLNLALWLRMGRLVYEHHMNFLSETPQTFDLGLE